MATVAKEATSALPSGCFRCSRCGVESTERTCFIIPERYSRPPRDIRCVTCEQRRLKPTARRSFTGLVLINFWPLVILGATTSEASGLYLMVGLLCGCLIYPFVLIAHELGHALTAWALRLEVGAIGIGYGSTVLRFELGSVPVQLHAWPLSGRVYVGSASLQLLRTRLWITTLMGPMTNALLVAATVHWWNTLENFGAPLPALCLAVNLMVAVINLTPHHVHDFGQTQRSDGLALIEIPRTSQSKLKLYLFSAGLMRSASRFEAGDFRGARECLAPALARVPENAWLAVMQSACFSYLGDYAAARAALAPFLERAPSEEAQVRAAVSNGMAFALLMESPSGEAGDISLRRADELSEESFAMYPCLLPYRSTRSLVLAALGRCDEAMGLLEYVHYATGSAGERSHQEAARAFALLKAGRATEARETARRAVLLEPTTSVFVARLGVLAA